MSKTRYTPWLYIYGQPIVWWSASGLPYTAAQLARRLERAKIETWIDVPTDEELDRLGLRKTQ